MKIISYFHGIRQKDFIVLKPVDKNDFFIIEKLFNNKKDRENRTKQEVLLRCEINAPYQHRTFKQNNAVWVLIGIIFQSMEGRNGTHEELYDLYLSLLEKSNIKFLMISFIFNSSLNKSIEKEENCS